MVGSCAYGAEHVAAFNTYQVPPFGLESNPSLARVLVDQLNEHLRPDYTISVEDVSRMRLTMTELRRGDAFDGLALFLHPVFVSDAARTKYTWSHPVLIDCNVLISNTAHPIDDDFATSLIGRTIGGIPGYHYLGIDELVAAGKVKREDSHDELTNLRKIAAGHIDAAIMPYSIYGTTIQRFPDAGRLSISRKPHSCFSRYILVGKGRSPKFVSALNNAIDTVTASPQWQATLQQIGFDTSRIDAWAKLVPVQ
jgi:polar amino acid transport system substrate-binding protein